VLPAGLDYDDDDHVAISPDEAVREAITCVFRRFDQLGSARQVVVSLRADGLRLPRRDIRTGKIAWAQASYPAVHGILIHPGYAGVFAYGRSKTEKRMGAGGNVITRQRRLPRDQWAVMIPGHHLGYISLETYDANIARLAANSPPPAGGAGGAAREGAAWLQGLLRCGRCGRLMQVNYHSSGSPAYRCGRANQMYGAATCQLIGGRRLHETVLAELLAALAPACLAATIQAMTDTEAQFRQNLAVFERALERARYEASRVLRQYDNVEPENRLVARTIEAALEDKLTAVRTAKTSSPPSRPAGPSPSPRRKPPGSPPPEPTCGPSSRPRPPPTPSARNSSARSSPRSPSPSRTTPARATPPGRARSRSSGKAAPAPCCRCRSPPAATTAASPAKTPWT
jgi:hypothetical protein